MNLKYKVLIASLIIIILFSFSVEAKEVKLIINDQKVESNLIIINGRTLVPAEIISKHFGDNINWINNEQELRINNENLKAKLIVGKDKAVVNSTTVPLQTKIRESNDKVLIPLRLLPKIYGGNLAWNASTKTIYYNFNQVTNISVKKFSNKSQVVIKSVAAPQYKISHYQQPERLVLDLKKISLKEIDNSTQMFNDLIKSIRISQFQVNPATVRVVVDINQMSDYQLIRDGSNLILEINGEDGVNASSITSSFKKFHWKDKRIVIDPGHGGEKPGAIGQSGVEEKKVNYQIASRIYQQLKSEGFQVILTRGKDQNLSLMQRVKLADNWPADLFISIHADYNYKSWINGTTTYAHWNASEDNWALAWYVQDEIVKRTKTNSNGLKAANFLVLRESKIPSILVETAFLSNPREEYLLTTSAFQQKVADGVVAGVKRYFYN
ncbi:N-acetylmuramoyl-L-alanine amidase family protein [Sporohalobacter salinus]|uniref:N-acetylmuramoyl-L-alanine amidase family protein n=1 Tax=Sporohalobacter salinus TaxID=1494606 RepID=UPI0019606798|nr:N-acetylmuramoyl-L-alanine amidase family protein [Sporohalobacter salinus]MBM7624867.1 N-acetylmuramoyl-L-alanine amidase [Sporohalobacter salinus]